MGLRRFTILISLLPTISSAFECYNFAANKNPSSTSASRLTCQTVIHVKADVDHALTSNAYLDCNQLTTVTFDNNIDHIGDQAFKNCINLKSVTLPTSLIYIGSHCFQNCISLASVYIPDTVQSMISDCFENCSSLTTVHIPMSLAAFEDCFVFCSSLSSFTFTQPSDGIHVFNQHNFYWSTYKTSTACLLLRTYGVNANTNSNTNTYDTYTTIMFATRSTTTLSMPTHVQMTLRQNTILTSPVNHIGIMAYRYTLLQGTLVIPNHINHLDQDSLGYLLQNIESLTIPSSVTIMNELAFRDSNGIKSFVVNTQNTNYYSHSGSVYTSSDNLLLFYPTNNQNTIIALSSDIKGFSHNTFAAGSKITTFALPTDAKYLKCYSPTTQQINGIAYYTSNTLLSKDGLTLVRVAPDYRPNPSSNLGTENTYYKVPDGVVNIGPNAFANSKIGHQSLVSNININKATTFNSWCFYQTWFRYVYPSMSVAIYCGSHTFHGAKIRGLSFSNKLECLGRHMCSYTHLETIDIAYDSKIKIIDDNFACYSSYLHTCRVPGSVEYIYNSAFKLTNLSEVVLPSTVKMIDKNAFSSIYALKKIVIPYGCLTVDSDAFGSCTLLETAIIENCNTCAHPFSFRSANEKLQPTCIATFYFTYEYKNMMYAGLHIVRLFLCLMSATHI